MVRQVNALAPKAAGTRSVYPKEVWDGRRELTPASLASTLTLQVCAHAYTYNNKCQKQFR